MTLVKKFALGALGALLLATTASAAIINSLPGGVSQPMPAVNEQTIGPRSFGTGLTWTGLSPGSVFDYTRFYGFGSNLFWSGLPPMAGTNGSAGTMSLAFASPVSAFLAEVNWTPGIGPGATMLAYDAANVLLETINLSTASANLVAPGYWGFQFGSAVIGRIDFSNQFIGFRDVSTSVTAGIPEPATWAMMLIGFAGLGLAARRRREAAAA